MISKWLSETFNPPAWGNKVLKNSTSKYNYTYGVTTAIFGLVASAGFIGGAFAYSLSEPEQASQMRDNVLGSITQPLTSDVPTPNMSPD